ncbi:ribonuclease P protein component [Commensalibacter nepenthis]|uniref:Ribonuclease P protein component n=1 Tax=Commensalibacter nepenthis TaxID=3043872 RepID=A0ABT6Q9K2_9PROT|nr:ribonuclease P protein component [Commensalibacter sp. TBRC 10068]MDI2113589.1 ribonuclease P protein component [Commensalibacter sp. TBRC 10068]
MTDTGNKLQPVLRLKKRVQFLNVAANGQKVPTSSIVLQLLHRNDGEAGRVGFTVTKKVGNAVVRNRVKRRLRSVMQEIAQTNAFQGIDMVMIGRKSTFEKPYKAIVKDFCWALRKAGVVLNK